MSSQTAFPPPRVRLVFVLRSAMSSVVVLLLALGLIAALAESSGAARIHVVQQGTNAFPFVLAALQDTVQVVSPGSEDEDVQLKTSVISRLNKDSQVYAANLPIGVLPNPRSVEVLENGNLLVTDRDIPMVAEMSLSGEYSDWIYTDPQLIQPFSAQRFQHDGQWLTLISDRRAKRVWAVDHGKQIVWQYGVYGDPGLGVDHLMDPFYARYCPDGTVLIVDNLDACRVIRVRYDDYAAGAANHGFKSGSIVWSYGTPGVAGQEAGQLAKPHCAQLLDNGNVLITDAGDDLGHASRVIEVDPRATGDPVWQFGGTGAAVVGNATLSGANYAARLSGGDTLVVDTDNQRVLRVAPDGSTRAEYDMTVLGAPAGHGTGPPGPRAAAYSDNDASRGSLIVAESDFSQIVSLGYQDATVISAPISCGEPNMKKAFVRFTWKGISGINKVNLRVKYRVDNREWQPCKARSYQLPPGTNGKTISYQVTMTTGNPQSTPKLDFISIQWTKAKKGVAGGGGGGKSPEGDNSGQSGTYTYPPSALGGTGTSGTGTGSGTYGGGTGSGSYGGGTGSASSGAGASSVTNADSLQPPVESSGSGAAAPVTGYEVQGQEGVSGVPLRAAEGAQAPADKKSGPPVPVVALIGVAVVVLAGLFMPWPFVAAQIRRIAGFDHTRPTRFLPFRSLRGGRL